jgi:hypothetical protein
MYWNDRLDVQIETRLIAQAVAIVEIELKGTLTRSPTGFCVGSRAKPTSCCNSPNTTQRRLGCRSRPARVTLEALSSGSVWVALGDGRVLARFANNSFDRTLTATAPFPGEQLTPCSFQIMTSLAII